MRQQGKEPREISQSPLVHSICGVRFEISGFLRLSFSHVRLLASLSRVYVNPLDRGTMPGRLVCNEAPECCMLHAVLSNEVLRG